MSTVLSAAVGTTDGKGSEYLTPRTDYAADPALATATTKDQMAVMGLSLAEGVALRAALRSPTLLRAQGFNGSWTTDPARVSNLFFQTLLAETWLPVAGSSVAEYQAEGKALFVTAADLALPSTPSWR